MSGLRVVIADDSALLREALAGLLERHGMSVVAQAGDAVQARRIVNQHRPDVAIFDIRMPPTGHLDGLTAALDIRSCFPGIGVLLLSRDVETAHLDILLGDRPIGIGHLLKQRIQGAAEFVSSVERVAGGECVLDSEIVSALMRPGNHRDKSVLQELLDQLGDPHRDA